MTDDVAIHNEAPSPEAHVNRKNGLFSDICWTTFGKGISTVFAFCLNTLIVRTLTKEDFGLIATINVLCSYFAMLSEYSATCIAQRELIRYPADCRKIYNTYVVTRLGTTAVAAVLFLAIATALGYMQYKLVIFFVAGHLFFSSIASFPLILLQSFSQFRAYSLLMAVISLLSAILIGGIVFWQKTIESYFCAVITVSVATFIIQHLVVAREFGSVLKPVIPTRGEVVALLSESTPLFLGSFCYLLFYRIDTLMVEKMVGLAEAAEFNVGFSVADQVAELLWVQFIVVYYPRMVEMYEREQAVLNRKLWGVTLRLLSVFSVLLIVSLLLSKFIFIMVFGARYAVSATYFTMLIPSLFLTAVLGLYYRILILTNSQWVYPMVMIAGAVLKFILDYVFINNFSTIGVVYATFIVNLLTALLILVYALSCLNHCQSKS